MCGRYSAIIDVKDLADLFGIELADNKPRYNIAPTQQAPVIVGAGQDYQLTTKRFGFTPNWYTGSALPSLIINARAETIAAKPTFRRLVERNRCLVLADGFYEWSLAKPKVPYRFTLPGNRLFAFAGLWDTYVTVDGSTCEGFAIITTEPCEAVAAVHDRMPVLLTDIVQYSAWLHRGYEEAIPLLGAYNGEIVKYEVTNYVNSPLNDDEKCILAANKLW